MPNKRKREGEREREGKSEIPRLTKIRPKSMASMKLSSLDGRNRAIVIAESLARVIAAIRTTSVRWRSCLPPKHRDCSSQTLRSLCFDLDCAIGVRSCIIGSRWNCRMACESWQRSLNASYWQFCPSKLSRSQDPNVQGKHLHRNSNSLLGELTICYVSLSEVLFNVGSIYSVCGNIGNLLADCLSFGIGCALSWIVPHHATIESSPSENLSTAVPKSHALRRSEFNLSANVRSFRDLSWTCRKSEAMIVGAPRSLQNSFCTMLLADYWFTLSWCMHAIGCNLADLPRLGNGPRTTNGRDMGGSPYRWGGQTARIRRFARPVFWPSSETPVSRRVVHLPAT